MTIRQLALACGVLMAACSAPDSDPLVFVDAGPLPDGDYWARFDATSGRADTGPPAPAAALLRGDGELLGLFVAAAGYLVVTWDGVELFDREGATRARWNTPYGASAAAFDGERLAVADGVLLTALDPSTLVEVSRITLARRCTAAAMLDGARLVCRNAEAEYDLSLSVYDLMGTGELGRSARFPDHRASRIFALPGHDAVVGLPPATFVVEPVLFRFEDDVATLAGRGDGSETESRVPFLALVAGDVPRVVNDRGFVFRLDGCGTPGSVCFERDGSLGTVGERERVVAFDDLEHASVVTLSEPAPWNAAEPRCASGCDVRRTDFLSRRVVGSGSFVGPLADVVALRLDALAASVVVAGHASCDGIRCRGWSLTRVALEAP